MTRIDPHATRSHRGARRSGAQSLSRLDKVCATDPLVGQDRQVPPNTYPRWDYFPRNVRPPEWVEPLVAEVRAAEARISTVD